MKKEHIKFTHLLDILIALGRKEVSFSDVDEELFKCGRIPELDFIGDWLAKQDLKQEESEFEMSKEQCQRAKAIASEHGIKYYEIMEEIESLTQGDWEGRGAKTVDKALDFLEWALRQPQSEEA